MGLIDAYRNQRGKVRRAFRRRFRVPLLKLTPDSKLSPIERFVRDGLNSRIYSSVPNSELSQVLVFGGYKGDSVEGWLARRPTALIHAYEPVPDYADHLRQRFSESPVIVHERGVGERGGSRTFSIMSDATSGHPGITETSSEQHESVRVRFESAKKAASGWADRIGVAEINIEGGEYELLSALAEVGVLSRIKHIFVQFHDVGKDTELLVTEARRQLSRAHHQVWNYEMVWEYWKLSEAN